MRCGWSEKEPTQRKIVQAKRYYKRTGETETFRFFLSSTETKEESNRKTLAIIFFSSPSVFVYMMKLAKMFFLIKGEVQQA